MPSGTLVIGPIQRKDRALPLVLVRRLLRSEASSRAAPRARARTRDSAVEPPFDPDDSLERREESARRVLHAFKERRRRRRGDDTYFGSADCFIDPGEAAPEHPDRERRRSEVMV